MTLIETAPLGPVSAEQVFEIKTMAESGQFADALIRLRKIKPLYPRNTFLVAMEKQLERLLVLPRGSEPSELQRKELLSSLPALVKGAADSLRQQPPARPQPAAAPAKQGLSDKEVARNQLKEQYFHHADEYLKKGAYGSALVEIRRVRIIAPDDPTVAEYERTIRQLVELQQRTGIRTQEQEQNAPAGLDSPGSGVEASPTTAPPVLEFDSTTVPLSEAGPRTDMTPVEPERRRSRTTPVVLIVVLALCLGIGALALLSNPEESMPVESPENTAEAPSAMPGQAVPPVTEASPEVPVGETAIVEQHQNTNPESPKGAPRVETNKTITQENKAIVAIAPQEQPVTVAPPVEPVSAESDPEIVRLEQPIFPEPASGASTSGEVIVMVQIDQNGKPVKTMVAKSTNPALNAPIVTAVLRSTYRAGSTPNGPATKWITLPFRR